MTPSPRLLSVKELAAALSRHPDYVYAMKRDGFAMPGGRATLASAMTWLAEHPRFRVRRRQLSGIGGNVALSG